MAIYKQKGSKNWWYKFVWNGELVRESTKQTNKRVAEQMEAVHRASLARGEVGIREHKLVPTLVAFANDQFLPFVRSTSPAKPNTDRFYENSVANLAAHSKISSLPLDSITSEIVAGYVAHRQGSGVQIATVNRDLATLRRIFHLAAEWEVVSKLLPRIRLLPGENHRERVLSLEEEMAYLNAAADIGHRIEHTYRSALHGIRAGRAHRHPQRQGQRLSAPHSRQSTSSGNTRDAQGTDSFRMDLSGAHRKRPHRGVEPQEAACLRGQRLGRAGVRSLHPAAHLPDPFGPYTWTRLRCTFSPAMRT